MYVLLNDNVDEIYNIVRHTELQNIDGVKILCSTLDDIWPNDYDGIQRHVVPIKY